VPKNTFFEGTKKFFCTKFFLGLFVHVQRWLVQKKNTADCNEDKIDWITIIKQLRKLNCVHILLLYFDKPPELNELKLKYGFTK